MPHYRDTKRTRLISKLDAKTSSANHLPLSKLQDEYRKCAESGCIIGTQALQTPKDEQADREWRIQTEYYNHYWYSTATHGNILEILLELEIRGLGHIARVRKDSKWKYLF